MPFKVTYEDEGYLYICVGIWRTENQRIQHCGKGSVSDGKCNLCGYGTAGAWKPGEDGQSGGTVPLYCAETGISGQICRI